MNHPLLRLLRLARPVWASMALASVISFATFCAGIGLMASAASIIARAALQPSIAELQLAIVGVRFFGIARGLLRYLERYVSHNVTFHLLARLRLWFYRALIPLAPARLIDLQGGDLLARITADIDVLENLFVRALAPPAAAGLVAAALGVFLALYDVRLILVAWAGLACAGLVVPWLTHRLGRRPGRRLVQERAALEALLIDGLQGLPDLLAFNQESQYRWRVRHRQSHFHSQQNKLTRVEGLSNALPTLLQALTLIATLWITTPLVRADLLTGVDLAVVSLAILAAFEAVFSLPPAFQHLETDLAAAERLFELSDQPPAVLTPDLPSSLPHAGALTVRDLRLRYRPDDRPALDGLTFTLHQGEKLALVGPSGAGKSSLVNALLRFWDYEAGTIMLADKELRTLDPDALPDRIALAPQQVGLFNLTVAENLRLARPQAGQAEMERAAQAAQIHDFLKTLPQGYETLIGEQGLQLSAGQRRRLTIARALLQDTPWLILDEPGADLDPLTAEALMAGILDWDPRQSLLLITHRLIGLQNFDQILVLSGGRCLQQGTHAKLLAEDGLYRRMWRLQIERQVVA